MPSTTPESHPKPALGELAGFFLKLGTIAFGGPAVHIAMMEDELVHRRKWVGRGEFLDLLAVANLLPGPSSTELAIFIGYKLRGWKGLIAAGVCFILPAFVMVSVLAWAYVQWGTISWAAGVLYGVKPVVIAVVIQALWRLAKTAVKSEAMAAVGVMALAACVVGVTPWVVVLGSGLLAAVIFGVGKKHGPLPMLGVMVPSTAAAVVGATTMGIFLVFLKIGCIVFGSGYVLLAFLREELVLRRGWLVESQLLDAVAIGQITPGPVFTTATFIGYVVGGPMGASAATVGIFVPAFVLVAMAGPWVGRLRQSKVAGAVLDGLNVGSLALMAYVTWELGRGAIVDGWTIGIAAVSAVVLVRWKVNATWLVLGGAVVGGVVKSFTG